MMVIRGDFLNCCLYGNVFFLFLHPVATKSIIFQANHLNQTNSNGPEVKIKLRENEMGHNFHFHHTFQCDKCRLHPAVRVTLNDSTLFKTENINSLTFVFVSKIGKMKDEFWMSWEWEHLVWGGGGADSVYIYIYKHTHEKNYLSCWNGFLDPCVAILKGII